IDQYHNAYMEFMHEVFDHPNLLDKITQGLSKEERHLVHLELLIMEQVEDWEIDIGKYDQESMWTKMKRMVVDLPNGKTTTIAMSQEPVKRYWFGMCPISSILGNMKLCSGCRVVGYIGQEEQKEDWPKHKVLCKALTKLRYCGGF
ncbi:Putative LOC101449370, partial [Caligus rogercresseyi]